VWNTLARNPLDVYGVQRSLHGLDSIFITDAPGVGVGCGKRQICRNKDSAPKEAFLAVGREVSVSKFAGGRTTLHWWEFGLIRVFNLDDSL
jgi:hypothetical protein